MSLPGKILSFARDYIHFRITRPGRVLLWVSFMALMLASAAPHLYVFMVPAFLLIVIFLTGLFFTPKVEIRGRLPEKAVAQTPLEVSYQITNRSRWTRYDLSLNFFDLPNTLEQLNPGDTIPSLGPGETASFTIRLLPKCRGIYHFRGPRCFTTFPFNIMRFGHIPGMTNRLTVIPNYHPLESMTLSATRQYFQGGITLASKVGDSPEYIGNRNFRPGDSPRKIDSRAWARLAYPAIKEYHDEYFTNIAIVLDTWLPEIKKIPSSGLPALEAAVSLTASIANYMSSGEYLINLFAAGPTLYRFRTGRHISHVDKLLEVLAGVEHCGSNPFEVITPALSSELTQISQIIFLFLDFDKARNALVQAAMEQGCEIRTVLIRNPDIPTTTDYEKSPGWIGPVFRIDPKQILSGTVREI